MKFLCSGDLHIKFLRPRYRIDDYYKSMLEKLRILVDLYYNNKCQKILQPGDFFDYPDQSNKVEVDLLKLFSTDNSILTVFGQHDLRWRRKDNTALYKFDKFGIVKILKEKHSIKQENICIYGCSWDEKVPIIQDKNSTNILLIHRMIVKDKPLWQGQTDYISAKDFMKKHNFDLVVSGDNHQSFTYEANGRYLINCGSLMRTNTSQRDHKPVVYIYDDETKKITQHFIPVKPIEEVMNLELADEIKERTEELNAFVDGLSSQYDTELDFEENLKQVMSINETPTHIKDITTEIIGEYYA